MSVLAGLFKWGPARVLAAQHRPCLNEDPGCRLAAPGGELGRPRWHCPQLRNAKRAPEYQTGRGPWGKKAHGKRAQPRPCATQSHRATLGGPRGDTCARQGDLVPEDACTTLGQMLHSWLLLATRPWSASKKKIAKISARKKFCAHCVPRHCCSRNFVWCLQTLSPKSFQSKMN